MLQWSSAVVVGSSSRDDRKTSRCSQQQLRLSRPMVYFGSSTFWGFLMADARSDWMGGYKEAELWLQRHPPIYGTSLHLQCHVFVKSGSM